jgi:predicted  nucleic acid-binding Zn-ribbon protein
MVRQRIGDIASDVAAHFQVIENIKSLQTAQKEMANTIKELGERIRDLQTEMKVLKAEVKFEALKETQTIVNAVQGGLNQRIEDLSIKVAITEKTILSLPQLANPPLRAPS